ncbi:hypothetical protein [Chryseosolibacter indicus]|uniref:Uncharacterized protein n=1 Tax=Chryseosolibacter indicus TaxID=2782351 RepID=A0ABS5VQF3_9BACT|nr:hypothetical protein [Chryseosolibacter indicus]MBT1703376.1 hypothetical protein [Chryseosolibacter indicus]
MITKKLAVPLVNDKILGQAVHCYVATTAISESAFEFVRSRLSPKCKIDIVTGLDELTSPAVLRKIWKHYQERITVKIFTKNVFHANVYVFDLPYRKSIGFLGSGALTMGGLKDYEEMFYKITDPKEIEALLSWYTSYYEFSEPLSENLIEEYELIYPALKQREIISREEKEQVIALTARGFRFDSINFRTQYFKKEDYQTFATNKITLNSPSVEAERNTVKEKLLQLHEQIKDHLEGLGFYSSNNADNLISSVDPFYYTDRSVRSMKLIYGRKDSELTGTYNRSRTEDFMNLQVVIRQKDVGVWLVIGKEKGSEEERELFRRKMEEEGYRGSLLKTIQGLGSGYWIEIFGERKPLDSFSTEDALWTFTKYDDWKYYSFIIGKNYTAGSPELSIDNIKTTIEKEAGKLALVYEHLKIRK